LSLIFRGTEVLVKPQGHYGYDWDPFKTLFYRGENYDASLEFGLDKRLPIIGKKEISTKPEGGYAVQLRPLKTFFVEGKSYDASLEFGLDEGSRYKKAVIINMTHDTGCTGNDWEKLLLKV